ncbi:hypothetical protein QJ054_33555 [Streptomyces sp. AN-3]|uniref:hypothetical protein n=1 Tax=Streptomyces sp. AN-3 TaxID=3044177 RepID=UPI00249ADB99|nr:hypothetical protein [Streptomyces sp. AN-3]MDI3101963.1 hypothetical protein [Streptomyces sp. AN-3]
MSEPTAPRPVPPPAVSWAQMLAPDAPPVVASTTITVDGVQITYEQHLDRHAWDRISSDPQALAAYETTLRRRLADAIVQRLDPPVTVHVPPPVGDGAARRAGERPGESVSRSN